MKKLSLNIILFVAAFTAQAQICDVAQSGQQLQVFNCSGSRTTTKLLFEGDLLSGFSESIIVVKSNTGLVKVYDAKFSTLASKYLFDGDAIKAIAGNNIIVKSSNGLITFYDKDFNRLGSRYE
jgi:hypothetical protein